MYFGANIKFLRKRKRRTQDELAFSLGMKRSTISGYENGVAQPGVEVLVKFSEYFNIAIDTLIKIDLSALSESMLSQLLDGYDVFVTGAKLRVLATTVDQENIENIELVNEKAKAGYARGYADPEYIRVLPTFQLPFLSANRKYRTFQISGDSMLPIPDKAWVTGEFIQNWNYLKDGDACIVLTLDDGLVFKIVEPHIKGRGLIRMHSLNKEYKSFDIHVNQIREIWKFVNYISTEMPEPPVPQEQIYQTVANLKEDIDRLKEKLL